MAETGHDLQTTPQSGTETRPDTTSQSPTMTAPPEIAEPAGETPPAATTTFDAAEPEGDLAAIPNWTYGTASVRTEPETEPSTRGYAPSFGPTGKRRSAFALVALSIVTLGIYPLVWHHSVNSEMSDFDFRMSVSPGRSTWAVTLPWLAGLLATLAGGILLLAAHGRLTLPVSLPTTSPVPYLLLAGLPLVSVLEVLIPFSAVAIVMTMERIRILEDRVGMPTDVQMAPASLPVWMLVPVVGGLVTIVRAQARLNTVWTRVQPPASRGRH